MYNLDFKLYVVHENIKYELSALCEGNVTLTSSRKNSPSNLTFKILRSAVKSGIAFGEGDFVSLFVNGTGIFKGRIFSRSRTKEQVITVTAYDQIRYLRNKKSYEYIGKKAGDVVKMIADDFKLKTGVIEDTGYVIPKRREEDETLMDIILNAVDITLINTNELYVLFDDFGELSLRNIKSMFIPLCVSDDGTMIDFNYKTDIDSDTYNQIKLMYENKKNSKYDVYVTKNAKKIAQWGVLQYTEKIDHPDLGKEKSKALLKLYSKAKKTLSVTGVIGQKRVRAGCLVPVILKVNELKVANYMLVEKVTHTFENREWTMDLIVSGGDFIG